MKKIKIPRKLLRFMPEEVPELEEHHIASHYATMFSGRRTLNGWALDVFKDSECCRDVIDMLAHRHQHSGYYPIFCFASTREEATRAAAAWNEIMRDLGYTELLEGRWGP